MLFDKKKSFFCVLQLRTKCSSLHKPLFFIRVFQSHMVKAMTRYKFFGGYMVFIIGHKGKHKWKRGIGRERAHV